MIKEIYLYCYTDGGAGALLSGGYCVLPGVSG